MSRRNEFEYLDLARRILHSGERMEQRAVLESTGERPYCLSRFGEHLRLDLSVYFPLLTTKKMSFKAVVAELLWFISGSTNAKDLENMGARIWSKWADENGELGPVYGKHWRRWDEFHMPKDNGNLVTVPGVDQLEDLENNMRAVIADPNHAAARRLVMINYNPGDLPPKAPPGCHTLVQFSIRKGRLDCCFYMRSADYFLGVPYNIASYATLTKVFANVLDLKPGFLTVHFGDVHLYSNHLEQVREQLEREPYGQPTLHIKRKLASVLEWNADDLELRDYASHPALAGEVAV